MRERAVLQAHALQKLEHLFQVRSDTKVRDNALH